MTPLHDQARAIWQAAVDAVKPDVLIHQSLSEPSLLTALADAPRIVVLGGGKAGALMSTALEQALAPVLPKMEGLVNVPAESIVPTKRIRLNPARPAATNQPTAEGVAGALEMLRLAREAGQNDIALCLISGGGSALLPAPVEGVTLADK